MVLDFRNDAEPASETPARSAGRGTTLPRLLPAGITVGGYAPVTRVSLNAIHNVSSKTPSELR
jgi:hypothetical protein